MDKAKKLIKIMYTYFTPIQMKQIQPCMVFIPPWKKANKAGEELRKATNNHTQSFIDRWIVK